MDVILLERISKLGQMGDVVKVKDGYARNFLLPQGKALRANNANKAVFESQRVELEARNLERKTEAEAVQTTLDGNTYIIIRSAGETGQLYGSVTTRDISASLDEAGFKVSKNQISLPTPIKVIGLHPITIALHPEVDSTISVNVARSEDEAVRQAAGEDLTTGDNFEAAPADEDDDLDLEAIFENPDDVELDDAELDDDSEEGSEDAGEEASEETAEEDTSEQDASEEAEDKKA